VKGPRRRALRSIRGQLLLLAVLVAVPLTVLATLRAFEQRRTELARLQQRAIENVDLVAEKLVNEGQRANALLVGVSQAVLPNTAPVTNDSVLQSISRSAMFGFSNIWINDTLGENIGAVMLPSGGRRAVALGNRAYFQRAINARRFTVGDPVRSRVLPGAPWMMPFVLPVLDHATHRVRSVVGASIWVDSLDALREVRRMPAGSVITVMDTTGTVIMRTADAEHWVGRRFGGTADFLHDLAIDSIVNLITSADGTPRQVAYRKVPSLGWMVYVGIPTSATIDLVQQDFFWGLATAALVTLLVLGATIWLTARIVEPIETLTADALTIAGGASAVRSRLTSDDEIGDLAHALNRMADTAVQQQAALADDIAALRAAELALEDSRDQLRQAQKMDALGSFAGGIAHDFNNYLTSIVGFSELALSQLPPDSQVRGDIKEVLASAHRASDVARQILIFSRKSVVEPQYVSPSQVVKGIDRMLGSLIGASIGLDLDCPDDVGTIHVDRGQLEQVIVNLATNARDAMPNGGVLSITIRSLTVAAEQNEFVSLADGTWIEIAVSDTGGGIPPDIRDQIFEPFFTTKERGRGTGLGLALVYSMVRQADGIIRVKSEEGRGTAFHLFFPQAIDVVQTERMTPQSTVELEEGTQILVVDDDPAIRAMVHEVLTRAGHSVLACADGAEALLHLRGGASYDLLLSDVLMPGMNGRELARRVQEEHPEMAVLLISGYVDDAQLARDVMASEIPYLAKPFTTDALRAKVRQVLDARRAALRRPLGV